MLNPTVSDDDDDDDELTYKTNPVKFFIEQIEVFTRLIEVFCEKNNLENYRHLQEFRVDNPQDYKVGDKIELSVLDNVEKVDVTGKSIGKGFQGTVKRWNFGRGPMGHGSKNHREPGSIGAGTTPSRVIKGKRMAGNMGNERVTVTKLKLVKVDAEKNLVLVKGSVPGCEGRLVTIVPTRTKWN